jgi:uncharacterized protein (DUF58 family)
MPFLPTRRLALWIALAGVAFLVGAPFAWLVNALLAGAVVADLWVLTRIGPVRAERDVPPRIPLGGESEIAYRFAAGGRRSLRLLWTDDPGPGLEPRGEDPRELWLEPGRGGQGASTLAGVERGPTWLGDLHMRVVGPLGLIARRERVAARDELVVQPGLSELRRERMDPLYRDQVVGARRFRDPGEGTEFARLREYVRGDDPRRIDWKATARRGSPIVREFEAERSQSVILVIDAGRLMMERFGGRSRLDHALAASLVVADRAAGHGDMVGILAFADRVQAYLPPSRVPLSRIADLLSRIEERRVEPDYPGAFGYLGRRLRRRSLVILFSDVVDVRTSSALLAHLTLGVRRHLPLLVAMGNPELIEVAGAPVEREEDAFRRAAAEELLQARAVALASVRRQGVIVADVRPDAAVQGALQAYAEVKRRGRL